MEKIEIEATQYTPYVLLDADNHLVVLRGESYPENTTEFYGALMNWVKDYLRSMGDASLTVDISLVYFNSSSSKVLMDLFDLLDDYAGQGKSIVVNWLYDEANDMAEEYGEEFAEDLEHLNFNLKAL